MDRRQLFGALGAGMVCGSASAQDHAMKKDNAGSPLAGPHAHFCGIHVAKSDPKYQLVTQHYCAAHSGGLFQCVLFDKTDKDAKLVGVEYIISDEAYRKLPETEQKYWHPHTYEVLAGGLIAPGMGPEQEKQFMKMVMTTWGKAWHTWPDFSTPIPMGDPVLIWSLTGDAQVDPKVVAARDAEFKCSTAKIGEKRREELGLEAPQIPHPKSMDAVGRQWTAEGADKPKAKRK